MANRRTFTDDQLVAAIEQSSCWSDVMQSLGKARDGNTSSAKSIALRLGVDTSHLVSRSTPAMRSAGDIPYTTGIMSGQTGSNGLGAAIMWFTSKGYNVSIPVEPCSYDLIAESDDGLKRVQVKTSSAYTGSGGARVNISKSVYDRSATPNARGKYRSAPYTDDDVDLFFIRCKSGETYLIPQSAVSGLKEIVVTDKYRSFLIA